MVAVAENDDDVVLAVPQGEDAWLGRGVIGLVKLGEDAVQFILLSLAPDLQDAGLHQQYRAIAEDAVAGRIAVRQAAAVKHQNGC